MTFQFLHAADLRLDTPFTGVSVTAPAVAAELRDASLNALDQLIRLAIDREVAFVILAGDTYEGPARGVRAQLDLLRGVRELSDRGIHTFIAPSAADPAARGWSAVREWPELVTLFREGTPTAVPVERDGQTIATVHGVTHPLSAEGAPSPADLASGLDLEGQGPHIAVLYGGPADQPEPAPPSTEWVEQAADVGVAYWALGQVRERGIWGRDPWVVSSGTAQARQASSNEHAANGVYVVNLDNAEAKAEPELVPIDRVRFDRIEYSIEGLADLAILRDRLVDTGRRCLADADGRSVLLQVELVGRGPVHTELYRPGALVELVEGLRTESLSEPPLLWWDRVDVSTTAVQDLQELQGRNDFIADLVDETQSLLGDDEARARRTADWDEELPSDLYHLLEAAAPSAVDPQQWRAAQDLAVDLVASDES